MNYSCSYLARWSGALAISMLVSMPALSQTVGSGTPNNLSTAHGSSADEGELDTIVVTAQRRAGTIEETPVAMTALSQTELQEMSIYNAFDMNKAVPGLTVNQDASDIGKATFSIRGRGTTFGTASGSVETYFADVPLSSPYGIPQLPPQFFDMQSIQVLKGPQGTLFGRDTTGGAVLLVPQAPTDDFGGYLRLQGGNYGDYQAEGAINLPISDKVELRIAGFHWSRDGYEHTIGGATDFQGQVLPSIDFMNQDVTEVRATLQVRPTDNLTNTTIFTFHTDTNRYTSNSRYLDPVSFFGPPILAANPNILSIGPRLAYTDVDINRPATNVWAVINTTAYEVSGALTLKNIFGFIDSSGYDLSPSDVDASDLAGVDLVKPPRPLKNWQTTDEIQAQGTLFNQRLSYTTGALIDLTREPSGSNINTLQASVEPPDTASDYEFYQATTTSKSVYGSLTYKLTDQLSMSGGIRNTWDHVEQSICEYEAPVPQLPTNPAACEATQLALGQPALLNEKKDFSGLTYDVGISYRPNNDAMVYGGFRHGYKRGGFTFNAGTIDQSFGPETVNDYYLGTKLSLAPLGLRGHFNIEGFYDLYHGMQVPYSTFGEEDGAPALVTLIQNIPQTVFRGFDTDFVVDATDWLRLTGAYTYIDAYFAKWPDLSVPGSTENLAVNPVALVSRNKLSLTGRLHHNFGDIGEIAFAATYNVQTRYFDDDNAVLEPALTNQIYGLGRQICAACNGASIIPGYSTVDLRAEWNYSRNISVALNVNNLLNKVYAIGGTGLWRFGFDDVIYGPPRMVTGEVVYHF